MKVIDIQPDSPLYGHVRKGYRLLKVNGREVADNLDCRYLMSEESVRLEFATGSGKNIRIDIDNDFQTDLGLQFETDILKICKNKCIFCFVHQQPKGMRKALYVRDDDFRLSFTHGNFISLSNINEGDIDRIIRQRLSPMYISVHSTDDSLRRFMFGNRRLPAILPLIKRLIESGIIVHSQAVLCPGINDGPALEKTITDLAGLYPGVASLGVVPVGLTKYRDKLHKLRPYTAAQGLKTLALVEAFQNQFRKELKTRFVYAADEFYILSGVEFPPLAAYETMPQFENGIGMMRSLLSDFSKRKKLLEKTKPNKRIALITGRAAGKYIEAEINYLMVTKGWPLEIIEVANRFWGKNVTVSGLLTGRDISAAIMKRKSDFDIFILPPNCLNDDDLFLDDMPLSFLREKSGIDIQVGSYSLVDTLKGAGV